MFKFDMTARDQLKELMLLYGENPDIDRESLDEDVASRILDVILINDERERNVILSWYLEREKEERIQEHNNVNKLISDVVKFKNKVREAKKQWEDRREISDIEDQILFS